MSKEQTSQETTNSRLTERAQRLFKALVENYIDSGQPVGSRTLSRAAGLDISPATVRNVMADLEDLGYIRAPHTSAGRVPTVLGYRLFIDTLLKIRPLNANVVGQLRKQLNAMMDAQDLVESASTLLSDVTRLAGVVTTPRQENISLRQIEFLSLSENRVLAILVVNQREVQNRILHMDRAYTPSELQQAANYLNAQFAGRNLRAVRRDLLDELKKVREDMDRMMRWAIELGEKAFADEPPRREDYVLMGQTNLMDYEDLTSGNTLRLLFEAFNQKREILLILDKCISAEGMQIFIGQESGYEVLDDCSLVTAPYSLDGDVMGVLGVIGPMRMAYDRVIPIVDITARLLGAALNTRN